MNEKPQTASTEPLEPTGALKVGSLKPGTLVLQDRFKVLQLLGRGGMGDVYLAEQVSLGRKVALKTLREDLSMQPGMTERFKREARLLSTVDHPSIVRVIDFGEAEGAYILVMEFVEGENLASEVRSGALDTGRAIAVMKNIAEGLAVIHAQGIIHRDLKPDNVLLTHGPEGERARLLDFGIARLAEEEGTAAMTQAGLVLGTPEYLAPEQATGGRVDARSDVYAFGVLAYRLLAGRHPFAGPSARDFLLQHITQTPPEIGTVAPALDSQPALRTLVMSCLSKEPAARPDGGKGLVAALAALETGPAPTTALRATPIPALASTVPSKQIAITGASLVVAAGQQLSRVSPKLRLGAVGAAVLIGLVIWLTGSKDPTLPKVEALLDQGQPAAALELLDASKKKAEPPLRRLKAEGFHQLKRHREEWDVYRALGAEHLEELRPAGLAALMDDFGKNDRDEVLRAMLGMLPKAQLERMESWAEGKASIAQWGALHYLDVMRTPEVDLVPGFISALDSTDCEICAQAARRLGQLNDKRAVPRLEALKASPRKQVLFFTESCGHDEASAALEKLNSPATPE